MGSKTKSLELYDRALKVTPGPPSDLRILPPGERPSFLVRGEGAHYWDIDGKEYIDFTVGNGTGILGHGNEEYLQALKNQLDDLIYLSALAFRTTMEVELAEKVVRHVPCAEKVRFCLTGTDAVQFAIRVARAYTKRPYFIRFEGHYHGWLDNVLGGVVNDEFLDKPYAIESDKDPLWTEGRSPGAFGESFKLPWNEIGILERVLEKHGRDVAMILMEPILCNAGCCPPRPGYLERVRELCTKHGIVLCFDEIITGFRVALNGAQGYLGVTPDLATFGKALAGGIPLAALAGKKEILDLFLEKRVIGGGTFNASPLGMVGALATLKILERDGGAFYKKVDRLQMKLMEGLKEISGRHGIPTLIQGPRGVFYFQFIDKEIAYSARDLTGADVARLNRFRTLLADEGVLMMWGGRWFISDGLNEKDVDKALECADRALQRLQTETKTGLSHGGCRTGL